MRTGGGSRRKRARLLLVLGVTVVLVAAVAARFSSGGKRHALVVAATTTTARAQTTTTSSTTTTTTTTLGPTGSSTTQPTSAADPSAGPDPTAPSTPPPPAPRPGVSTRPKYAHVTVGQWDDVYVTVHGLGDSVTLSYDDGSPDQVGSGPFGCDYYSAVPGKFSHRWMTAGNHAVYVTVHGSADCSADPATFTTAAVTLPISVDTPQDTGSNGPSPPNGYVNDSNTGPGTFDVLANDYDGLMRNAIVDWGDGSPTDYIRLDTYEYCVYGPQPMRDGVHVTGNHVYASSMPATATVTITLYSVGCDQQSEQSATMTLTIPTR